MKNMEKVIKVMSTLEEKKQKIAVDFKELSLVSSSASRKKARQLFEELSYAEQMRVWYAVGDEELSLEDINKLSVHARIVLIAQLIVEDCVPETFEELEADVKLMKEEEQEEKLEIDGAEEYIDAYDAEI
ncbi:MAG: hypothetical protein HFI16_14990 [Lachnospiraceae bacterium]|nr:hypothetical protein [Lachnospiraceae bacterium]